MEIIDRDTADARGLLRYFTGEPCRNGHVAERYVSNGCCIACILRTSRGSRAPNTFVFPTRFAAPPGMALTPDLIRAVQVRLQANVLPALMREEYNRLAGPLVAGPMTDKAAGAPYEAFRNAGWTDAQLVNAGYMEERRARLPLGGLPKIPAPATPAAGRPPEVPYVAPTIGAHPDSGRVPEGTDVSLDTDDEGLVL